jgi:hypothetical protein
MPLNKLFKIEAFSLSFIEEVLESKVSIFYIAIAKTVSFKVIINCANHALLPTAALSKGII